MHDKVMDFDAVFIKHRAEQAGLTKFKYTGSIVSESRLTKTNYPNTDNLNCPSGTGYLSHKDHKKLTKNESSLIKSTGLFKMKDVFYLAGAGNSICSENYIYLYHISIVPDL